MYPKIKNQQTRLFKCKSNILQPFGRIRPNGYSFNQTLRIVNICVLKALNKLHIKNIHQTRHKVSWF